MASGVVAEFQTSRSGSAFRGRDGRGDCRGARGAAGIPVATRLMIRVVLDTNIIVSALLQPLGPPAQVFVLAIGGSIQLCISGSVYAEYEEVISRPRSDTQADVFP